MYRNLSLENIENEVWKDIEGYEGKYQVSNMGRVKSLNYKGCIGKERILKQVFNDYGYLKVCLSKDGKTKQIKVHRLVAQTFIENIENKPYIDHINTIRTDNRVENLRFVTRIENMNNELTKEKLRAYTGRNTSRYKGFICIFPNGEITKEMAGKELGELLGVSESVVMKLAKNGEPYSPRFKKNRWLNGIRVFYAEDYKELVGDNNVA